MRYKQRMMAIVVAWISLFLAMARAGSPPPVELVDVYRGHVDLSQYWVSEKFDGVRGYWDGHQLWTRGGQVVDVPAWFTDNWPDTAMDGELWAGYGRFSRASAIVRTAGSDDAVWHEMSYRVFDLPGDSGNFDSRVSAIGKVVDGIGDPWVVAIRQFRVTDKRQLHVALERVLAKGGEGLVLHRGDLPYRPGRGVGLLKLKPHEDAEAKVIAINPGHGQLAELMGSIDVRTPDGRVFSIGSGFTDKERADPPPIGAWVTYRFNGFTSTGLPRFARFLRLRPGGPPPG